MSGSGGKSQSTTPSRLNSIQVNQSSYGNCVPLLYGTGRASITLIDYVDFKATPQTQKSAGKGGGSSTTTGYSYSATLVMLLGEGILRGITQVYMDQTQTTMAAENLSFFAGVGLQPPWSYMVTNHPDHALSYDHMALVVAPNFDLGSSAAIQNLTFETQGMFLWQGVGPDAEPSQIIVDYCTDPNHGVGFPYLAPLTGANSYQDYCVANGFFISPQETTQRAAQDFLSEILQLTNSNSVNTPGVGLRIVPYGDSVVTGNGVTWTPNLTPIYTFQDADYCPQDGQAPVTGSIIPANETYNLWRVEYLDRANQYNVAIAEFKDDQDIAVNGVRVASTVSLHEITTRQVAVSVAALLCFRNLYIRSTFQFRVRADYSALEPMDLVTINDSTSGIVNQLVRITETDDDENDFFTITAEEMLVGPASAPLYDTALAAGFAANYGADPGSVAAPYIFTAPPLLVDPANGGYQEWIAVGGQSGLWGGADIYASLDNITYSQVGAKANPSRYGVLVQALGLGTDPDTANNLIVSFSSTVPLSIPSGTRADADALRTLCIVDGEFISYQTVTPMGNNTFSFAYLRRGNYGSAISAHLAGSFFAIIDTAIFRMPFDPGMSGQPVWFKFVSWNYYGGGRQDLSTVPAFQAFFQGQNGGQLLAAGATPLIATGQCVNVGARAFKSGGVSAWDSQCFSVDTFASGCTVKFRPTQTNLSVMVGLTLPPIINADPSHLQFAWYTAFDGTAYIYENGILVFPTRPYTTADIFEIRYDAKFISYYISGVLWRSIQAPGLTFLMDALFFSPGAAIDNIYFGALNPANTSPFVARGQCVVSGENIQKVGGTQAWDSDVYSLEGYPACHVTWKCNDAAHDLMIGLGNKPGLDTGFANIFCAFDCQANGNWQIYFEGAPLPTVLPGTHTTGTYTASTVFAILFDVNNGINGVQWLVDNVVVLNSQALQANVFLDSSFNTPGAGVHFLQYGPTTQLQFSDTSQIGLNATTNVSTTSATGPIATATNGALTNMNTITVGPVEFDSTVVITANAFWLFNNTSGSAKSFPLTYGISTNSGNTGLNPMFVQQVTSIAAGVTIQGSVSAEQSFAQLAGTTTTYFVNAQTSGATVGPSYSLNNITLKAEVIKR